MFTLYFDRPWVQKMKWLTRWITLSCLLLFVPQSDGLDLVTNGIGELEMNDNSEGLLSSSLEAEQRWWNVWMW